MSSSCILSGVKVKPEEKLPSAEAFVATVAASIAAFKKKHENDSSSSSPACNILNCTVVEKGGRRGTAYIDFSSNAEAEFTVKACAEFPASIRLPGEATDAAVVLTVEVRPEKKEVPALPGAPGQNNNGNNKRPAPQQHQQQQDQQQQNRGNGAAAAAAHSSAPPKPQQQQQNHNPQQQNQQAPTLYVRCKHFDRIHHVFDFFRSHDITGHADDCVLAAHSKKPYFLLEWGKNTAAYDQCLALDGSMFQGEEVSVKQSVQSAAEYKQKKPDALSLATKRQGQIRQREEEAAVVAATMVPISILMARKQPAASAAAAQQPKPPAPAPPRDDDDG